MNRSIRLIIILLFFIPYITSFIQFTFEEELIPNPFDYARITDVDYKAILVDEPNSNAKIVVTEKLTFDIHAASKDNLFWELWRELPEDNIDGLDVKYKVNSVKQILDDGTEIIFGESPQLYWYDEDYIASNTTLGPNKWYHSEGPYNEYYRRYESLMFYVDGLYREKVTFEIEYEMSNAAFKYNDCSELYLCMYSGNTIKHLNSFKGQILIPDSDMPSENNYEAHTYGTNNAEFAFKESSTKNPGYHTFSFNLDNHDLKFNLQNQYIEFCLISLGEDKHKFTDYAPNNHYSNTDVLEELRSEHEIYFSNYKKYQTFKMIIFVICFLIAFSILKKLSNADKSIEQTYNFYKPTMPKMHYFRDIPSNIDPTLAAELVFCKHKHKPKDNDGYSALMLSLVRKGYIELEKIDPEKDWNSYNVKIIIKNTPLELVRGSLDSISPNTNTFKKLSKAEELYFNLILRHSNGGELPISSFQSKVSNDYLNTYTFVKAIERSTASMGVSENLFQDKSYKKVSNLLNSKSKTFFILGIIFLIVVNLISYQTNIGLAFGSFTFLGITLLLGGFIYKTLANRYILFTQEGEDEYIKWRGLYNFLNSETLMKEKTIIELPIWEQYLIYATAFGISKKVIKALKIRCPDMDLSTSPLLNNSYYRSTNFRFASRSFTTATHTASYSYSSSRFSSYGGYGGYGGGGRGGGGGRRWSLKAKRGLTNPRFIFYISKYFFILIFFGSSLSFVIKTSIPFF